MLKRPSSAPFGNRTSVCGRRVTARRPRGAISPAHTVAMLPTFSAPTMISAKRPASASNSVRMRSLRANKRGTQAVVEASTLNSRPGTNTVSSSRPASGICTRW